MLHVKHTQYTQPSSREALCLFEDAETNQRPDQQLLEVSLGACAVGGQWPLAMELLQRCRWGPDAWIQNGDIELT